MDNINKPFPVLLLKYLCVYWIRATGDYKFNITTEANEEEIKAIHKFKRLVANQRGIKNQFNDKFVSLIHF